MNNANNPENPWKEVSLDDYEAHMSLSNVYQLQTLDKIMGSQFASRPVSSVAIVGVAGGNGLGNLAKLPSITQVYGIDINPDYLRASARRHPELDGRYHTLLADINNPGVILPNVEMVVANLFIEYVGCDNFARAIERISPLHVSCVIQIDPIDSTDSFVSDSPYALRLEALDRVHDTVDANQLIAAMSRYGYRLAATSTTPLPNGKAFKRLDFDATT